MKNQELSTELRIAFREAEATALRGFLFWLRQRNALSPSWRNHTEELIYQYQATRSELPPSKQEAEATLQLGGGEVPRETTEPANEMQRRLDEVRKDQHGLSLSRSTLPEFTGQMKEASDVSLDVLVLIAQQLSLARMLFRDGGPVCDSGVTLIAWVQLFHKGNKIYLVGLTSGELKWVKL